MLEPPQGSFTLCPITWPPPKNTWQSLTIFKTFKNSLANIALSRLPLSDRGFINLPKGFHATVLLAQPKDSDLFKTVACFLFRDFGVLVYTGFTSKYHNPIWNSICLCHQTNSFLLQMLWVGPQIYPLHFLNPNWIIQSCIHPLFDIWDLWPTWVFGQAMQFDILGRHEDESKYQCLPSLLLQYWFFNAVNLD